MNDNQNKIITGLMIIAAFVILYIVYKILRNTGLIKSQQEQDIKDKFYTLSTTESLKPAYWHTISQKNKSAVLTFTPKTAENIAKTLKDAFGLFNDNEAKIYGVLSDRIKTKTQISFIAETMQKKFNTSFISLIEDNLNIDEKKKIIDIIDAKPIGLINKKGQIIK